MPDYQLYCFAQSGNAYRAALMLNLIGAKWKPMWVDFFAGGVQRTPQFRTEINEMGEVPVLLVDGKKRLTQSSVILTYLARQSGQYLPKGEDEELEALRWIVFDNQKTNGFLGPYRFLKNWAKPTPDQAVFNFLKGRIDGNLAIVNKRLERRRSCWATGRPSPTSQCARICSIRRKNTASTSAKIIRPSQRFSTG